MAENPNSSTAQIYRLKEGGDLGERNLAIKKPVFFLFSFQLVILYGFDFFLVFIKDILRPAEAHGGPELSHASLFYDVNNVKPMHIPFAIIYHKLRPNVGKYSSPISHLSLILLQGFQVPCCVETVFSAFRLASTSKLYYLFKRN